LGGFGDFVGDGVVDGVGDGVGVGDGGGEPCMKYGSRPIAPKAARELDEVRTRQS
jgi:hypothetical protein